MANTFIVSLAFSDIISGIGGIIGAYREDPGRTHFYWPIELNYLYLYVELVTTIARVTKLILPIYTSIRSTTQQKQSGANRSVV